MVIRGTIANKQNFTQTNKKQVLESLVERNLSYLIFKTNTS